MIGKVGNTIKKNENEGQYGGGSEVGIAAEGCLVTQKDCQF